MKLNILSVLGDAIDKYGQSDKYQIASVVREWLEDCYGKNWRVTIGEIGTWQSAGPVFEDRYLGITETNLRWFITIFQQTP